MNITAVPSQPVKIARSNTPAEAPTPEQPRSSDGFSWGGAAAGVGGAVAGYFGGALATAGARAVGAGLSDLALKAMPATQVSPQLAGILSTGLALTVVGGALLGTAAGVCVGTGIAYQAGSGAQRSDAGMHLAEKETKASRGWQPFAKQLESGAELRSQLGGVHSAEGFKGAIGSGAQAGASFFGPVGAVAGKIQGALIGASVGAIVGLPLSAALQSIAGPVATAVPYVVMGATALGGGLMGAKIGEPVGHVVGSVAGSVAGAVGGGLYHAGHKLAGGGGESA